jgi:hypothetical protein
MMTMITRPGRTLGVALALGVLAGAGPVQRLEAQVLLRTPEHQECRCVDKDGKPIEHCSCFALPDVGRIVARAAPEGRARLGVTLADAKEGAQVRGAEVASVMEGGPAETAGIRKGDILTRVDGKSLLEPLGADVEREFDEGSSLPVQRLMEIVSGIEPGQKVEVEYLRDGQRATATVEARELDSWSWSVVGPDWDPEAFQGRMKDLEGRLRNLTVHVSPEGREIRIFGDSARAPQVLLREAPEARAFTFVTEDDERLWACPGDAATPGFLVGFSHRCAGGLELLELKAGLADYFGTTTGVLVADVHKDSKLGLQPGDVILAVGDREATDPDRVRRILSSYGADETVSLRIMRQKRETTVTGTLGK